jgi:ATP-dependent DNA helicase RecG
MKIITQKEKILQIDKIAKEKFAKLNISSFCELALIIPHSYEDLRIHNKLQEHSMQVIDATVESVFRAANSLQITFYAHNFGHSITGVMFRPKPYMMHQFQVGQRDYYYGKIECKLGKCTIAMPKKVSSVGAIIAKYKTKLRSDVMLRFVEKYLTKEALLAEGLDENISQKLLDLHFTNNSHKDLKNLDNETLDALKYTELFTYMKQLSKKRTYFKSMLHIDTNPKEWVATLPFKLTNEQQQAINEIETDLAKDVAARRMVVGDVGSGKTMVILATAYMVGKNRSVLMAPTTILAQQLYAEALKYLPQLNITLVTNKTAKVNLELYDFIIGTHALLYRELPKSAVVMVDEQHRFGTAQRNMLEKLVSSGETKPHFFQFSATPIPRTQAMIETAHIDVSLITSTPFKKDISTNIIHKQDFKSLLLHVESEISKNNQVLLVYPLVEQSEMMAYQSIDEARGYWERKFKNVYVTHGKDKDKESVFSEFAKDGDMLISTTVVEVGISLPKLSTVIIVGAERLGLSTLHQLRGRVSRTGLKGYCFLYTNQTSSPRLDEFSKTTSGFDIANLDLKYRKSGDLLKGDTQSGKQFRWVDLAEDEKIVNMVKSDLF